MRFITLEKEQILHLSNFFTSNSVVFVDRGGKNISCPRVQDTLATPLPFKWGGPVHLHTLHIPKATAV